MTNFGILMEIRNIDKPFDWSRKLIDYGVGEIMFTSINNDGLMNGYNLSLLEQIDKIGKVPYIFCGGAGNINHVLQVFKNSKCSAVALGSALHYNKISVLELKKELSKNGLEIRI